MTLLCIDASVVVKWFLDEPGFEQARGLPNAFALIAPDIVTIEVAHAIRRRVVRRELSSSIAREIIGMAGELPITLWSSQSLLSDAFDLALRFNRGVYDALYASLAVTEGCHCVTADRRFYDATAAAFPETMVFIDQIPELLQ